MLTQYINSALKKAHYEVEEGVFYAEIPDFDGVLAHRNTLEECREQLIEVLEGWLIVGIRHGHFLPIIENMKAA
jgi:predicted RNase H-like HicB family nuclease